MEVLSNTYSGRTTRKLLDKRPHGNLEQGNAVLLQKHNILNPYPANVEKMVSS